MKLRAYRGKPFLCYVFFVANVAVRCRDGGCNLDNRAINPSPEHERASKGDWLQRYWPQFGSWCMYLHLHFYLLLSRQLTWDFRSTHYQTHLNINTGKKSLPCITFLTKVIFFQVAFAATFSIARMVGGPYLTYVVLSAMQITPSLIIKVNPEAGKCFPVDPIELALACFTQYW